MKISALRDPTGGMTPGGHTITDEFAFEWPFVCAGVYLEVGIERCWLSRDEAMAVAGMIAAAAADA